VKDVQFNKLRSYNHQICAIEMNKRMLTCFQDKAYQVTALQNRPLGHWRNIDPQQRAADVRAAQELEWERLLDDDDDVL